MTRPGCVHSLAPHQQPYIDLLSQVRGFYSHFAYAFCFISELANPIGLPGNIIERRRLMGKEFSAAGANNEISEISWALWAAIKKETFDILVRNGRPWIFDFDLFSTKYFFGPEEVVRKFRGDTFKCVCFLFTQTKFYPFRKFKNQRVRVEFAGGNAFDNVIRRNFPVLIPYKVDGLGSFKIYYSRWWIAFLYYYLSRLYFQPHIKSVLPFFQLELPTTFYYLLPNNLFCGSQKA